MPKPIAQLIKRLEGVVINQQRTCEELKEEQQRLRVSARVASLPPRHLAALQQLAATLQRARHGGGAASAVSSEGGVGVGGGPSSSGCGSDPSSAPATDALSDTAALAAALHVHAPPAQPAAPATAGAGGGPAALLQAGSAASSASDRAAADTDTAGPSATRQAGGAPASSQPPGLGLPGDPRSHGSTTTAAGGGNNLEAAAAAAAAAAASGASSSGGEAASDPLSEADACLLCDPLAPGGDLGWCPEEAAAWHASGTAPARTTDGLRGMLQALSAAAGCLLP
jgi:hypothetical protein